MSGFLLDTDVVSLLSPGRSGLPAAFGSWLDEQDRHDRLFLSAVTLHEIEKGIHLLIGRGATARAEGYKSWLSSLETTFRDRILIIDAAVALASGALEAAAIASGHNPGMADALIAGTAKVHQLSVVTRNTRHFAAFPDVPLLDPQGVR